MARKIPSYTRGVSVTKERKRQNGGVSAETIHEKSDGRIYTRRHRAVFQCVLDAYAWQQCISEAQCEAGLKFYREYSRSVLGIKLYDQEAGNKGEYGMTLISNINGNEALRQAFEALSFSQRELVISVCVDNCRAGTTRKVKYLAKALQILADLWGIRD